MRGGIVIGLIAATAFVAVSAGRASAQSDSVLTYHNDQSRAGNYVIPALTWDKARSLHLDENFAPRVAGHLYAQPLYWRPPGAGAGTGMLVVATEDDVVQAFDAASGKEMWRRSLGKPAPLLTLPCGNIDPLGITGTPVIDPASQSIYVDALVDQTSGPTHRVFGLSLKDGSILPGWPVDVAAALHKQGKSFIARDQNQRSALSLIDETLYVPFSGHFGDCGSYHGWVIGLPLHEPQNVISFETGAAGGGIWAQGGVSAVGDNLFFATGNTFSERAWNGGEAIFHVGPNLQWSGDKKDFFAPRDWRALNERDEDLGGSNPIPLNVPATNGSSALLLALGKDRKAYLLNRKDLGGIGGELVAATVSQGAIRTAPSAYPVGDAIFVAFQSPGTQCPNTSRDNGVVALKIISGAPPRLTTAWCGTIRGGGSTMVTTTDGHANPIVWMLGAEGDNRLHAFRGDTGETIFTSEPLSGLHHFQTLIATAERLYVGVDGRVYAFAF
jgi:outer membrane protein assembly factor BamB